MIIYISNRLFSKFSCFILPRILFSRYFLHHAKRIIQFIEDHLTNGLDFKGYVTNNFPFIFDFYLVNVKAFGQVSVDHLLYLWCNVKMASYFTGFNTSFRTIFCGDSLSRVF